MGACEGQSLVFLTAGTTATVRRSGTFRGHSPPIAEGAAFTRAVSVNIGFKVCLYMVRFLMPGQRMLLSYFLDTFGHGPLHRALFLRTETWLPGGVIIRCPQSGPQPVCCASGRRVVSSGGNRCREALHRLPWRVVTTTAPGRLRGRHRATARHLLWDCLHCAPCSPCPPTPLL